MIDYERASAEELAEHFSTISRQRVQQIVRKFKDKGNSEVIEKIRQAKAILKMQRYKAKKGCTLQEVERARRMWLCIVGRAGRRAAYEDCTIAWRSEAEFREWALGQIGFNDAGYELDKDLLVKGNRVYGPDRCVFLPQEINTMLVGCYRAKRRGPYPIGVCFNRGSGTFVAQMSDHQEAGLDKYLGSFKTIEEAFACYKQAKEAKIKRLAEKWRDRIEPQAYKALMERTVEWND